jgi:NlpC/P60 family putative phage cell wall peptidase
MNSADVVTEARTWLGTRFHHQGRLKGVGVDCAGLVVGVAEAMGLQVQDRTDYTRQPDGTMLQETCDAQLIQIALEDIRPGDVLLMRFEQEPQHLAFVGDYEFGGLSLIHAYAQSRKVVETRLDDVWLARVVAAYRFDGVDP